MNFDLLRRLRRLEMTAARARAEMTVFTLENGTQFLTEFDPMSYLLQNGTQTPRGRIARYEHGEGKDIDPMSRSICEYIGELIKGETV